ncbi:MAG: SIMPL domain-containing protein [Fusobacteriaceae bacterium]
MEKKESLIWPAIITAFGIGVAGFFIYSGIKYFKNYERSVAVKGLSEKIVKSDLASWNINFSVSGDELKDVYREISENQKTIKEFLRSKGFREDELQVGTLITNDNWNNNYDGRVQNQQRYLITGNIILTTKNVDLVYKISQSSGELVDKGIVVTYSNINYFYTDIKEIKEEMLIEAIKNAKFAAEIFAKNSESEIIGIKNASQGIFNITSPDTLSGDSVTVEKKVRVVTSVDFFIK